MAAPRCPKCNASAYKDHAGYHEAKHGVHGVTHVAAHHPLGAFLMLGMSAVYAAGLLDKYQCSRCGHRF